MGNDPYGWGAQKQAVAENQARYAHANQEAAYGWYAQQQALGPASARSCPAAPSSHLLVVLGWTLGVLLLPVVFIPLLLVRKGPLIVEAPSLLRQYWVRGLGWLTFVGFGVLFTLTSATPIPTLLGYIVVVGGGIGVAKLLRIGKAFRWVSLQLWKRVAHHLTRRS